MEQLTFRVWNITHENKIAPEHGPHPRSYPRNYTIPHEDIAEACHGGPDAKDVLAEVIGEHGETGDALESFDYREIKHTRMVGVEAFTVGTVDRAYGGPEEGGWYYDAFEPKRVFYVRADRAERLRRLLEAWCQDRNPERPWSTDTLWTVRKGVERRTRRPHYC